MIQATLEFERQALGEVLDGFFTLRPELKPSHYSVGEDEVGEVITDHRGFAASVKDREHGFFLKGSHVMYDVGLAGNKPIICNCFLDVEPSLVKEFLLHMAAAKPIFGFACDLEERNCRNRITVKIGASTIESWVGRDTKKYLPGLYWLTLIPESLARLHSVSVGDMVKAAAEHVILPGKQVLLQFYKKPEDWLSNKGKMDTIYASSPGIFNVEKIRPAAMAAGTYVELQSILRDWH